MVSTSLPFETKCLSNMEILIGQHKVGALLDSGSSVSLIVADLVRRTRTEVDRDHSKRLLSATGDDLKIVGRVLLPLEIGTMRANHEFTVVSELITPVILGRDFLSAHKLKLDFENGIVKSPVYGIISMYNDTRLKLSSENSTSFNKHSESKSSYEENSQYSCQLHENQTSIVESVAQISTQKEDNGCDECCIPSFTEDSR